MTPSDLRHSRESLGLSQSALGQLLGISRSSIARYELGLWSIPKVVELAIRAILLERK